MKRRLVLNLNTLGVGQRPAAWRHDRIPPHAIIDPGYWSEVARTAERGGLDAVFLADTPGLVDPSNRPSGFLEPTVLDAFLAARTERIGFVATVTSTFNDPVEWAARALSLDLASGGRFAWNVVTTAENARIGGNFGVTTFPDRDVRYARADEFVRAVRALWQSAGTGRDVDFAGEYFHFNAHLDMPPSPQGHPLVVQAGGSPQGRALGARNADMLFTAELVLDAAREHYRAAKAEAAAAGRDPDDLLVLPGVSFVLADTETAAREKYDALEALAPGAADYALARMSDSLGIDARDLDLDAPLPAEVLAAEVSAAGFRGSLGYRESVLRLVAEQPDASLRQLLRYFGGYGQRIIIGTPEQAAEGIAAWFEQEAADGFNLMIDRIPDGLDIFVDHVVPLLRHRGIAREDEHGQDTLRERLLRSHRAPLPSSARPRVRGS
ncbi:LLM class flavin-dependent oxidoreductase [Curtobacterium sp. BRB10]|uniref:LLM class flavin-dependent oxidoreductase n=1 Tax=Curtobacterium sp. BRB10 TaxID=2962579 RepID=UPI002881F392|nr:LLM class flavin-dependent oxidoreductase [Curtobacterium sp. BRB10]MDT0234810.1 LLM class flavin-dependent oxidoreductase [Curtobacterium sp. BRB10]